VSAWLELVGTTTGGEVGDEHAPSTTASEMNAPRTKGSLRDMASIIGTGTPKVDR
jgi:hypothetical protein